jgi:nucleoside-diphosphate-sugar epimerase
MQDGWMRVVVIGGTGVVGRAAVPALLGAGHTVDLVCRSVANEEFAEAWGLRPVSLSLFDTEALAEAISGADALLNFATHLPVGYAAVRGQAWRRNDDLRVRGTAHVVAAAELAGVRRVVQGSSSVLYADAADRWIDESSPVEIRPVTEPLAVAEARVQEYATGVRTGVLLRFGTIVGDDPQTRFWLRAAGNGRPVGIGRPDGWAQVLHTDDVGPAVVAALATPSGVYNVGAAPVLKADLVEGYAAATGAASGAFLGPVLRRLAGARIEPMTRSRRVSSDRFTAQSGWVPSRPLFDPSWFDAARSPFVRASAGV